MSNGAPLEFVREEDFVEYFLFPRLTSNVEDAEKVKNDLQNILQQISQVIAEYTNGYIWHKDEFTLTARTKEQRILIEDETSNDDVEVDEGDKGLPPHLYGITHFGDNIQDEWFIAFLIFEITKKIPGIVGRIADSDGEFLLIEAADSLPGWANPDTCEQRVFIYEGQVHLVQNPCSNAKKAPPIATSIAIIWDNPTSHRVPTDVQNSIEGRLEEFKHDRKKFIHHQVVRVPLAIAAILKQRPSLIAPACRAFYDRDTIDMKACRAMRYFPPENRVKTRVAFTRFLYAMTAHSKYVPDRRTGWDLPMRSDTEEYKEDILGVKIACGFEILATQAKESDDVDNDKEWKSYLRSLEKKGYFKQNIEGSNDYTRLLNEAKQFYKTNRDRFNTGPNVGKEILSLLRNIEINAEQLKQDEKNLPPSDSEDWMNVSAEELDAELTRKFGIRKLYNANGNFNASEFTENLSEFLTKKSDYDGVEEGSSGTPSPKVLKKGVKKSVSMRRATENNPIDEKSCNSKSNDVSFDPDSFQTHVKNFLDFVIPEDNWESTSEMSDYEDDEDLDKNIEEMAKTKAIKTDLKAYMDQMDKELAKTTIGKTYETSSNNIHDPDDFDDIETFKPIDIDVNTLRNMMDSYKSQAGGPGPVSNLLSAMGMGMSTDNRLSPEKEADLNGTQV